MSEVTEKDRADYQAALRSTNGHKLQIGRASIALEGAVAVNEIENLDLVQTSLTLFEDQLKKIETILDREAGNPACPEYFILDLTNYVLEKGTVASKVKKLIKLNEKPAEVPKTPALDVSGIGDAISASLNKLNFRQPISNSDLPKFYGDAAEYVPFIECFNYLIENDESIPDAMKAQYLKRCLPEKTLKGEPNSAYQIVRLLVPNAENYALMRAKLEERFKVNYVNKVTYLTNLRKLNTWKMCN